MAKLLVFQHVPYEPLGTLDPLIRSQKHRVRYVNFGREPFARPEIEGYDGLIVLGGPMNVGEEQTYPHLQTEKRLISKAIEKGLPVLGICLGAQLIASALGSKVYPAPVQEIGWYPIQVTANGQRDLLFSEFESFENVFQWHQFTFDLPQQAQLLIKGAQITNQAFKYKENVYGFQFHLEANLALIKRWLELPCHREELGADRADARIKEIWNDTLNELGRSLELSRAVFSEFLQLLPAVNTQHRFRHRSF